MDSWGGMSGINADMVSSSRLREKEELQRLNERFIAYVTRIRNLGHQASNVDMSAFLRSTKILEEEITNLKNMYENELEKLRREIEGSAYGRNTLQVQNHKQQKYIEELQDRLTIETDKNSRLLDNINILQRRIGNLEAEVQDAHLAAQRPQEEVDQLQRSVDSLVREVEQWKHRCEEQQVASQENEDRLQQVMNKMEFSNKVHDQEIKDYQNRLDTTAVTILNLEARVRDLSAADVNVNEMLKQARETAEMELRKYQFESEEQYSRTLSALKAQIDYYADTVEQLSLEKSELNGSIEELQAKIRNLEGHMANLQHQKRTLEDTVTLERNRGAEHIRQLEKKLKNVQDMLVTKMFEVTSARDSNIPLKTEIEALKALLEEEERRISVPVDMVSTAAFQTSQPQPPSTNDILKTSSLSTIKAAVSSYPQPAVVSNVQSMADSKTRSALGVTSPHFRYEEYPQFSTSYSHALYSREEDTLAYDGGYNTGLEDDDLLRQEISLPMTGSQYFYESSPSFSRLHVDPSTPLTSQAVGPILPKTNSPPIKSNPDVTDPDRTKAKEKTWNYVQAKFGCGRDYFEEMFHSPQKNTLISKPRPKSSPIERQLPSSFHDYTVSTSRFNNVFTHSATGDLSILEVDQEGKYVRLVNDGPKEIEIGGYIIRQNVDGHPTAVFKFPSNIKFPASTIITIWSAINDPQVHNPPTDFYWKEQQKWGIGPECSTILCQANGQAVAWTTVAHRYSKDALGKSTKMDEADNQNDDEDIRDNNSLSEQNMDSGPKSEPVFLRREKQQPHLLKSSHPHGSSPAAVVHPQIKQKPVPTLGNEHSYHTQPQTIPGNPHYVSGQTASNIRISGSSQQPRPATIRGNGTLANKQAGTIHISPRSLYLSSLQDHVINDTRDRAGSLVKLMS